MKKSFRTLRHVVKWERFLDADFSPSSALDLSPGFITGHDEPGEIELLRVVRFIPWPRFISRWTDERGRRVDEVVARGCFFLLYIKIRV